MEDKFDKVEVVVKKTTKIAVLIIGSILTILLTIFLAWEQFSSKVSGVKKTETKNVIDTISNKVKIDTLYIKTEKVVSTPKEKTIKEEPKKDIIDKSSDIIDKADKIKGFIKK